MAIETSPTFRRVLIGLGIAAALTLAYMLRGVLLPLFFAFLLAYALDPAVDRLEALRVPRALGAILVLVGLTTVVVVALMFAVPMFVDEFKAATAELPTQVAGLQARLEPWMLSTFKIKMPHTWGEWAEKLGTQFPALKDTLKNAFFGTLDYVGVALSALIVPVFALYLLIDFDRIVARTAQLMPRRWIRPVTEVASQIHRTLGGYVRGQLTACFVLAALYAIGLRIIDIRLAVPIGVLTGMLAFVPYVGFGTGLILAVAMSLLDWHGFRPVIGVIAVMGFVQVLDGMVITPRIVGRSVGLAPLEVLITMTAAGSLLGPFGVLLAVPLGAVTKILVQRIVKVYLGSDFYKQKEDAP